MFRTMFARLAVIAIAAVLLAMPAKSQGVNNLQYLKVVGVSITPAATAAAIGTSQQVFNTYLGLAVGDQVFVVGPVPTALCPNTGARVSATNTLQLDFTTLTAAACTPAAGVYTVYDIKAN